MKSARVWLKQLLIKYDQADKADQLRMWWARVRNHRSNRRFMRQHPNVALPPDRDLYETYRLDYTKYYHGGQATARWLIDHWLRHRDSLPVEVLDWGCGPGRIVRHMPTLLPDSRNICGSDFNIETIGWCSEHLAGIDFRVNRLRPPLPWVASTFDWIYGISVLTHLSIEMQQLWLSEFRRVLRPTGLLMLTTQGDAFRHLLTPAELSQYDRAIPVIRAAGSEGRRVYSAFHAPAAFAGQLIDFEVVAHVSGQLNGSRPEQDLWCLQPPA